MKKLLFLTLLSSFSVQALTVGCPDLSKTPLKEIKAKYNLEVEFLEDVRVIERTGFQPIHDEAKSQRDVEIWGNIWEQVFAVTDNTPLKRIASGSVFEVANLGSVEFDGSNPDFYSGVALAFKSKEVRGVFLKGGSLKTASFDKFTLPLAEEIAREKKEKYYPLSIFNNIDSLMLECKEKEEEM